MAKKTTKVEEVKAAEVKAPLTWTVSDDMMSITSSDGRKGKAVEVEQVTCKGCMYIDDCEKYNGSADIMMFMHCSKPSRIEAKVHENIIWVEDVAAPVPEDAEKFYAENKGEMAAALPPVALDEVEAIERPDGSLDPRVESIALNLIDQSPYQVRVVDVESESFKELVASIVESGLINPITVRFIEATGRYELIAGHRRFAACEMIGMLVAPCYLLKVSDRKAEDMTCCENLNREDLLPIDEALTVKAMLDHGRTREEIAKITGKSTRWVYRREAAARLSASWVMRARDLKLSSKFLEFASALDEKTSESIFNDHAINDPLWKDGGNLGMLAKLSMVAHRKLVAAPWMGVCPEECNACKKRTDASELVAEDGESFCLDAECWARHMAELADRTEAKCKAKGIPVKRVTEETLMEMDVEEARSEEYDTCVLSTTERGEVEIYWGRSQPKSEKLQKKAAIKKPTEQNVFEMAFAGEVLRRMETLATSGTDMHGFLACALMVGLDLSAFRPSGTKGFICDQRTKDVHAWMLNMYLDQEVREPGKVFVSSFQDCVEQELRNRLECKNPFDTASQYSLAGAVVCAFNLDKADVERCATDSVKKEKKRK